MNISFFTDKEAEGGCDLPKVTQLDASRFSIQTQVVSHGILLHSLLKHQGFGGLRGVSLAGIRTALHGNESC